MDAARITGTVVLEELAGGPLHVAARPERAGDGPLAAQVDLPGAGPFTIEVPAGTWWLEATLGLSLPGAAALTAWCHEPITVGAGEEVTGVEIVLAVPENVR